MFIPNKIFYEKDIINYELGRELLKKYQQYGIPLELIDNHNNIPQMRAKPNSEFPQMKRDLIIGIRKTHKFVPNNKISDFLVPYTSSGCTAMCLYCYLVCNYNKCSYLRLFVNREEMLEKVIKFSNESDKELTFEIGSNSDLVLENTITNNLEWTIENFAKRGKGYLTFPTKFDMIDSLLDLDHRGKIITRVSANPSEIINSIELGTSKLNDRIKAINKLKDAGYKVGILIAPIILIPNWKVLYENLFIELSDGLSENVKSNVFFEFIFMTYSYVHRMINKEAFPNAIELYDKNIMTGRGIGKYTYSKSIRKEAEDFFKVCLKKYFPNNEIKYIV